MRKDGARQGSLGRKSYNQGAKTEKALFLVTACWTLESGAINGSIFSGEKRPQLINSVGIVVAIMYVYLRESPVCLFICLDNFRIYGGFRGHNRFCLLVDRGG